MRLFPVLSFSCVLLVASCARPIAVKVTTTPVAGVELTLNRLVTEQTKAESATVGEPGEPILRTGVSDCVFQDVPQGRDLTIVARKEGYEVTSVTVPAYAEPLGFSLLWSPRAWSSLIWSSTSPRAMYLRAEDADHREIDLETEGITIEMKPVPTSETYRHTALPPFDAAKMKGW